MKAIRITSMVFLAVLFINPILFAEQDVDGSKDHSLFTRMPGYYIDGYSQKDYDSFDFEGKGGEMVSVEGRYTHITYRPNEYGKCASPIQIGRNYQNAEKKLEGRFCLISLPMAHTQQ